MSLKPVLAVGLAVGGLCLAGTLSSALTESEPSPPNMTDHKIDMRTVVWVGDRQWTVRPLSPWVITAHIRAVSEAPLRGLLDRQRGRALDEFADPQPDRWRDPIALLSDVDTDPAGLHACGLVGRLVIRRLVIRGLDALTP